MKSFPFILSLTLSLVFSPLVWSHTGHQAGRKLIFPDHPEFLALKCDLHMHTVFSDGSVWPNIRVEEALRDGLDAIAMTEHLEYLPKKDDMRTEDRNRAYQVAMRAARNSDLIVINGSEITREMPPGHNNAIFIEDANKLLIDDAVAVFEEAQRQDAFVFWNHPAWPRHRKDGVAKLDDLHRELIRKNLIHGIEVVNSSTFSDEALQIALDHDLTILATSDVHGLVDWDYDVPHSHRPVTLVLARERSEAGLADALRTGRTVAWHKDTLIGHEQYLKPLLSAALSVTETTYIRDYSVLSVTISNASSVNFTLLNEGPFNFQNHANLVTIPALGSTRVDVKPLERKTELNLNFRVLNAVTAPETHPLITLPVKVQLRPGFVNP